MTHNLKIWPEHYSAVCAGVKRAELRKNDRDYRVGDTLDLCEWDKDDGSFTGEFISVTVTHVADVSEWMPGYVLLSIELALREREEPVAVLDIQSGRQDGNKFALVFTRATHTLPDDVYNLYTAPPAPVAVGWIACSERMPEREYVLAADFSGAYYLPSLPNTQVGIYADWFEDGKPSWDDGDGNDLHLKQVTHWMPLPEAPTNN